MRRFLLIASVVALPLQDHLPPIAGFSVMYLMFALLTIVAVIAHPLALVRVASSRVFIAAAAFVASSFVSEALHTGADFSMSLRILQMFVGAIVIASYCRSDPRAFDSVFTGLVVAGVWVGGLVVRGTYSVIAESGATDFVGASVVRLAAFERVGLKANVNMVAFICAAAAVVALTRAILARTRTARILDGTAAFICMLAVFLTVSRSGIAALGVALVYTLFRLVNRRLFWRVALFGIGMAVLFRVVVPAAVYSRFSFSTGVSMSGKHEARVALYYAAFDTVHDWFVTGVGAGNFWSHWGMEHQFSSGDETVGPHNSLLAVTMYWGVAALFTISVLLLITWISVMRRSPILTTQQWMCAQILLIVMLFLTLTSHEFYAKEFSLLFGIAAACDVGRHARLRARRTAPVA